MISDPLDRVTQMLRDQIAATGDVDALPIGRDVAIARLAEALRAKARGRRRTRVLSTVAVATCVALLLRWCCVDRATRPLCRDDRA